MITTSSTYFSNKMNDFSLCRHFFCRRTKVPPVICDDVDEDVAAEHLRVASGAASSDILQVTKLTKVYQTLKKKVYAVKKLSVGIPAGEVSSETGEHL